MRFRLRTLLFVLVIGLPILAAIIFVGAYLVSEHRWSQSLRNGIDPVTGAARK